MTNNEIFFVISSDFSLFPGTGGTESFTIGHARELMRRGFDCRIVTVGREKPDGRSLVPDIRFMDVAHERDLSKIDATLIAVTDPFVVPTKRPAYAFAHVPPRSTSYSPAHYEAALQTGHTVIANSRYAQQQWQSALGIDVEAMPVVYPFAHPAFAAVRRPMQKRRKTRVLFAGRLHIHKGIYLFLEALHHPLLRSGEFEFSVTTAYGPSKDVDDALVLTTLLEYHPWINLVQARSTPESMAELLADHDIVVMPSNPAIWQEAFGMLSVEAQHAGCRVVAAEAGGLPETDTGIGSLHLFAGGDSHALARAIVQAHYAGPVKQAMRQRAGQRFTLQQSVDSFLATIGVSDSSSPHR